MTTINTLRGKEDYISALRADMYPKNEIEDLKKYILMLEDKIKYLKKIIKEIIWKY